MHVDRLIRWSAVCVGFVLMCGCATLIGKSTAFRLAQTTEELVEEPTDGPYEDPRSGDALFSVHGVDDIEAFDVEYLAREVLDDVELFASKQLSPDGEDLDLSAWAGTFRGETCIISATGPIDGTWLTLYFECPF